MSCPQPSAQGSERQNRTSDISPAIDLQLPWDLCQPCIAKAVGALEKGFPGGSVVKNPSAMQATQVRFLGRKDPLEEEMVTHSCILAWKIPWTEEPGRQQSRGCKESDTTETTYHT